ncbi:hypothetical protein [Hyphomicrobium sp. CS1GBMeth3]|uniref:hypothetical protein n=1 Tax=Hyphomicrobium sp. CS1GBMeth3 TaxID=1892845 RepID=UPI000930E349|nr:hypothetical protein [Hyphomicrobium sp. CS1GBMeth3]
MAGLLGNFDDEPQGLLAGLQQGFMNPITLTGLGLLTGGGWDGAMQGARVGAAFEEDRRRRSMAAQEKQAYRGLLENPNLRSNLPPGFGDMLLAAGPDRGFPLLAKYADPDRALDVEMLRANLAKTKAETSALSQKDAMSGIIMGLLGDGETDASAASPLAPFLPDTAPPPLPQSAPTAPASGLQNAVDEGLPALWQNTSNRGSDMSKDANGTVTVERVANAPRSPYAGEPPAWYQPAQLALTQNAAPFEGPPAASVSGGQDFVQTPFGPMTRDKARRLGGAMLFDPRFAPAGKEFLDASRAVAPGMQKPAINALQEKQFNTTEQYSRLKGIEQSWKPEYQTIESRLGFKWNALLDKFSSTRKSLAPQQRQELAAYSANRAEALNNLNQYIKEITGAAMTISEAERIKKAQPNPGEGVFDGDSPIEFEAKLKNGIRMSKMALARYNYLSQNGFPADVEQMAKALPLDDMPKFIQRRTNELLKQSLDSNPGLTPQDVAPVVRQRLRAEFGIDA